MNVWELWWADFPFEEDHSMTSNRPVIILNIEPLEVLSVKVTTHDVRDTDKYDTPIVNWQSAGLRQPSVARVGKTMLLTTDKFTGRIGVLHPDDQSAIMNQYMDYIKSR